MVFATSKSPIRVEQGPLIPAMTPDSYPDSARTAADSVRFPIAEGGGPEFALQGLSGMFDLKRHLRRFWSFD